MDLKLLEHLCQIQSELYHIPFYIYCEKKRIFSQEPFPVNCDLIFPFWEELTDTRNAYNYLLTEDLLVIGYVKDVDTGLSIIIGPLAIGKVTEKDILKIILSSKNTISFNNMTSIKNYFETTLLVSLDSILPLICLLHGFLNSEAISISDLIPGKTLPIKEIQIKENLYSLNLEEDYESIWCKINQDYVSKTTYYISHGLVQELETMINQSIAAPIGKIASNTLRHYKNACIILTFISLNAALLGNLRPELCFRLGEIYNQKIESCTDLKALTTITHELRRDFCKRVHEQISPQTQHPAIKTVIRYITDHIQDRLNLSDLAKAANLSKEYLSSKFISEIGVSIPTYIKQEKLETAKKILILTDTPLSEISEYLSFSSQSYFQTVFKKMEGCTPSEYRVLNKNV